MPLPGDLSQYLRGMPVRSIMGAVAPQAMVAGTMARSLLPAFLQQRGFTLPGDVYAGRTDPNSDEAITRSMDLAMIAPMAALPAAERDAVGIFGGRLAANRLAGKGATGPKAALDLAEKMDVAGASGEEIYAATNKLLEGTPYAGASKGADGKWRFEIDDSGLNVRKGEPGRTGTIGGHYSHPELFSAYPRVKDEWSRLTVSPSALSRSRLGQR